MDAKSPLACLIPPHPSVGLQASSIIVPYAFLVPSLFGNLQLLHRPVGSEGSEQAGTDAVDAEHGGETGAFSLGAVR